jgi:hypothetical protein
MLTTMELSGQLQLAQDVASPDRSRVCGVIGA